MQTTIKIEIKETTVLKLIKCNVLVAEINAIYDDYIYVTREEKNGNVLYTYESNTDNGLVIHIEFDRYLFLEIKE